MYRFKLLILNRATVDGTDEWTDSTDTNLRTL